MTKIPLEASIKVSKAFDSQFKEGVRRELRRMLKASANKIRRSLKKRIGEAIRQTLREGETYAAIQNGILRGQLGLEDPSVIEPIIDTWAKNIEVKYEPNNRLGVIKIGMIRDDYSDVLTLPEASYNYTNRQNQNNVIEWLNMLLLEGSRVIVAEYEFDDTGLGRTGFGIMVRGVGGWAVPPQFQGTATDNFVIRELMAAAPTFDLIAQDELEKVFNG